MASHYQYCIMEYFVNGITLSIMLNILFIMLQNIFENFSGVALSILHRAIFWHRFIDIEEIFKRIEENFKSVTNNKCYIAKYFVSGIVLSIFHRGIFRQWRHTVNNAECLVYSVAQKILHRRKRRQWRRIINIASRNILFKESHKRYCIAENLVSGVAR